MGYKGFLYSFTYKGYGGIASWLLPAGRGGTVWKFGVWCDSKRSIVSTSSRVVDPVIQEDYL